MADSSFKAINWYPGHMAKTMRLIDSSIKNIDVVIEILDARIPFSSKNPMLAKIAESKPRLLVLNKADLADKSVTSSWVAVYKRGGYDVIEISAKDKKAADSVVEAAKSCFAKNMSAFSQKTAERAKPRAMVVGIPNVGKSTLINSISNSSKAKVEDRPGVTRGPQWISLKEIELLDMPGVLWKKLENQDGALKLAFTGAIKDDILDKTDLASWLLEYIRKVYPQRLCERFKIDCDISDIPRFELLELVARNRGMLLRKGECDMERAAACVLDEVRGNKLGLISYEEPSDYGL
ncbi:MAG: ribosome biogenesis GTPase YlqF [Oscillospiraceae bacterium]